MAHGTNPRADSIYFTSCKSNQVFQPGWFLGFLRSSLLLQVTKQMKKLKQSYGANIHSSNTGSETEDLEKFQCFNTLFHFNS